MILGFPCLYILLYNFLVVFVKTVSPSFLLPSPSHDFYCPHMPATRAHYVHFDHM